MKCDLSNWKWKKKLGGLGDERLHITKECIDWVNETLAWWHRSCFRVLWGNDSEEIDWNGIEGKEVPW